MDNDGDGKVDEDGLGGWVTPFVATTAGQDVGQTFASVEDAGKTLRIDLFSPSVFGGNVVYSPTVYAKVVNNGTVPVVVVNVEVTVVPPYELWDRNQDTTITDFAPLGVCNQDLGDECAAPLVADVLGLTEGVTVLEPGVPVPIQVKISMTPAAKPTVAYALTITITGNNFNEPGA